MIKSASVRERRYATVLIEPGLIVMTTFSGNSPIDVHSVELAYDSVTARIISCVVRGWPRGGKHRLLDRRVHDDYVRLDWLKDIVEKYRPGGKRS